MDERTLLEKKPPGAAAVYVERRLLVGRREAAAMLSISDESTPRTSPSKAFKKIDRS
jgi:hypothetical protein